MAISIRCGCGKQLHAREELAGKKAKCPGCGQVIEIPSPQPDDALYELADPPPVPTFGARMRFDTDAAEQVDNPNQTWHRAPVERRPSAKPRSESRELTGDPSSPREYLYWILALALIPLGFSLLQAEDPGIKSRLEKRLENASAEVTANVERVLASKPTLPAILEALPDHRLDDKAHLPFDTMWHWAYALIAALVFLVLVACCFSRERVPPAQLFAVGLFTGTVGIVFLIAVQYAAQYASVAHIRARGIVGLILLIAQLIGFSYRAALGDTNFVFSFLGFTFGVGLCEEICKALPMLGYYRRMPTMGWRGACLWGLASGVGFGVSEGVMYAGDHYNGVSGPEIYLVRFLSCVALHAMWAAAVGVSIYRRQDSLQGDLEWHEYALAVLRIIAVPMVLHGLYDTLLKKEMNGLALAAAVVSFAWLAWQVESARRADGEVVHWPEAPPNSCPKGAHMREDDLFDWLDAALRAFGSVAVDGEDYRDPPLDVLRYYRRAVRLHALPILGRSLSIIAVLRQPIDVDSIAGYPKLLKRVGIAVNSRFPPWKKPGGLSVGLTSLVTTPEPIGAQDDEALGKALATRPSTRIVSLGLIRLNLGQEAMSFALASGPHGLFPEPEAIVDGLTPHFRRFVPLITG